ncbi:AAA family ATPase [Primorskyibacter sp. 2E233]|uniref:AAA family ATPase n=1 Tax=Primorskyibacter sp. 2E233 TaxID=3413431 RepID=UPI003BF1AF58
MREQEFRSWLENSGSDEKTIGSRVSSAKRIEAAIGDLDERLDAVGYETLSAQFSYSAEDERDDRPNPSPISIDGNLRNGLASLKQALRLYDSFRSSDPSKQSNDAVIKQMARVEIEGAMDAYEAYRETGEDGPFLGKNFRTPKDFWVRSSKPRKNRIFPSKPVHYGANGRVGSSGGWGGPSYSAAALHNSGYIIVDEQDQPVAFPTDKPFLVRDADRIRLCALNYFIAPARERGEAYVSIRAGDLSKELMLNEAWPNVCQALKGKKFQELAGVPPPVQEGPDASTTTTFTFDVREDGKQRTMKTIADSHSQTATNLILYGPPGTGKTYATAWEAVRLCLGDDTAAPFKGDRDALMAEYRRLVGEGRIEFTTFHQSMSYEEFVEGLRPVTDAEQETETSAGFRLEPVPGIFYRISKRAEVRTGGAPDQDLAKEVQHDLVTLEGRNVHQMSLGEAGTRGGEAIFEEAIEKSIALFGFVDHDWSAEVYENYDNIRAWCEQTDEELYATPNGVAAMTHHFRNKVSVGDILVVSKGNFQFRAIGKVVGDYEYIRRESGHYSHRRSVQWFWVDRDGVPVDEIHDSNFTQKTIYGLKKDRLNIAALECYLNLGRVGDEDVPTQPENFVLIIDEINRANISKVFGELITLLEQDKRLGADNELRVQLPYSKKRFAVPPNLHIVGTMNTADRSIALLDTALRRRFTFQELMPDPTVLSEDVGGINLRTLLSTINDRIEYLFDREHQIGHAYFTGCGNRADQKT